MLKAGEWLPPRLQLRFRHAQKNMRISSRKTINAFRTMIALSIKAPIRFSINGVKTPWLALTLPVTTTSLRLVSCRESHSCQSTGNQHHLITCQDFEPVHAALSGTQEETQPQS